MKIISTADGSSSLFSEQFQVSYHSKHGAIEESIHVFISAGLHKKITEGYESISILEIGLGTGLNALLTHIECLRNPKISIYYQGIEKYPVPLEIAQILNYPSELTADTVDTFQSIHAADWESPIHISKNFVLKKKQADFLDIKTKDTFDIIYFDAFAPNAQEELWTESMMQKMYDSLKNNGILVSYCAKGSFKRALKAVGFKVEALPGPTGKREMTRAIKF